MSQPEPTQAPTQTRHPWRATLRTVVAALVGLLGLLPVLATVPGVESVPGWSRAVAIAAVVTRIMAMPGVDEWLRRFLPVLASEPRA